MRRAFLSLYGLIVLSVIAVGWGLDKLWQYYSPVETVAQADKDTLSLFEQTFFYTPSEHRLSTLASLNQALTFSADLFSVEDFAQSSLLQKITTGEVVVVHDANGDRLVYKLLNLNSAVVSSPAQAPSTIVRLRYPKVKQGSSVLYDVLLLVFYGAIALVVLFWVWPLSRDLSKLERHTKLVGRDKVPEPLHFSHTSTVYDLASAFNHMSQRIRDLLASHKEMTYAVSHELRTPLARMKFALEMAANSKDPKAVQAKLVSVRDDVTEMDVLVNQLLSYASFEQNDQPLDLQEGDLNCLVDQLIERMVQAKPSGVVQFVFNPCAKGFSTRVLCEWHLMERAVSNLLQNAQRHAASKVLVEIKGDDAHVEVWVSDDGLGVPDAERERIFQSFVRLQTDINAQVRGFGLGLAIVQRVMRWHHGEVVVRSSEAGGACFVLSWPMPKKAVKKRSTPIAKY